MAWIRRLPDGTKIDVTAEYRNKKIIEQKNSIINDTSIYDSISFDIMQFFLRLPIIIMCLMLLTIPLPLLETIPIQDKLLPVLAFYIISSHMMGFRGMF